MTIERMTEHTITAPGGTDLASCYSLGGHLRRTTVLFGWASPLTAGQVEEKVEVVSKVEKAIALAREIISLRARIAELMARLAKLVGEAPVKKGDHKKRVAQTIKKRRGAGNYAEPATIERAIELRKAGVSLRAIAHETGLNRETVQQYVPTVERADAARLMHARLRREGRPLSPPRRRRRGGGEADLSPNTCR